MHMNIIDFHTHPFIQPFHNICIYRETLQSTFSLRQNFADIGIGHICGSVVESGSDFETIRRCNRQALILKNSSETFILPASTFILTMCKNPVRN